MKLIDFEEQLPNISRIQYATKEIKDKWEIKLDIARDTTRKLMFAGINSELFECADYSCSQNDLPYVSSYLASIGLSFVVGDSYRGSNGTVQYTGSIAKSVGSANRYNEFRRVSNKSLPELEQMLRMRGMPKCCIDFRLEMVKKGYGIDFTWQRGLNNDSSVIKNQRETTVRIRDSVDWRTNSSLSRFGVVYLPFVTCSDTCEEAIKIASDLSDIAKKEDIDTSVLEELLKMPVEWNALKGIAYISTPIFKGEINSVTCYPTYILQREGTFFPEEAPNALKFPWNERWKFHGVKTDCS